MSQEFSFKLSFDDFDVSLLPDGDAGDFAARVSSFFVSQFQGFGGKARVIINDQERVIEVVWTKESRWQEPKEKILNLLHAGKLTEALPMIWTLVQHDPKIADNLYHLGVIYSELRQYAKATAVLERLIEVAPSHVHGLTALGVAEIANGNLLIAEEWLTKALQVEPTNRWALRNLGACLMKQCRFEDARTTLQTCLRVAPNDIAALVGLGEALEALGESGEADAVYRRAVKIGGPDHVIDIAKDRLTKMAETKLRSDAKFRPDAVEYMLFALDRFSTMTPQAIQALAYEIATLGMQGFSINDPSKKYLLKSLGGEFTGLQLVSIMYAAYQQFAPGQDVGIDLSEEYAVAVGKRK